MVAIEDVPPLQVTAWTGAYVRQGVVPEPDKITATFRYNLPGGAEFTLSSDNDLVPVLAADDARAVITYRPEPDGDDPEPDPITISGPVEEVDGEGPVDDASRTFRITDDFVDVFNDTLGWPNPTGTDQQQGDDGAYYKITGPAETVLTDIVKKNTVRLGKPLVVPTSLGRGPAMTVSIRMHPLFDRLWPGFDAAGLGVRIVQVGATRQLQIYQPATFTRALTAESEAVADGTYQLKKPTVTRVIVMAGGEGTARVMRRYIDAAREAQYKIIREVSLDARDIDPAAPDRDTQMQARANEALAEGAPKTGLSVQLSETDWFQFGRGFGLGDVVPIKLAGAPVLTDRIREVTVAWDPENGVVVTPLVGEWQESTSAQIKKVVAASAKAVRDMQRSL